MYNWLEQIFVTDPWNYNENHRFCMIFNICLYFPNSQNNFFVKNVT